MKCLGIITATFCVLASPYPASAVEHCNAKPGVQLSEGSNAPWTIQVQTDPESVPLNAPFDAIVTICSKQKHAPSRVTIDATMPAHKHGMNYEPKTTQIDNRRYKAKNLVFHMPGVWRLEVTAYDDQKPYRFAHDIPVQ